MEQLEYAFPAEVTVAVAGEQLTLTAFKAKHLRPYLSITRRINEKARRIGVELAAAQQAATAAGVETFQLTEDNIPLDLIHERCYEEYVELIMAATGKPLVWVEDLGMDDLIVLVGIINELNARRYQPKKAEARVLTATASR